MDNLITKKTNNAWQNPTHPFFTVITPGYNRHETIGRSIESVKKQTYGNFEYIVVDDGSVQAQSIDDIIVNLWRACNFQLCT